MNWKDAPHLFANGKFKVRYGNKDYSFLGMDREGRNCRIIAPRDVEPFAGLQEETYKAITVCQLIARPISDMKDEEVTAYSENWEGEEDRGRRVFSELCEFQDGPVKLFLHLLSIGVYPLDDEEDVIF